MQNSKLQIPSSKLQRTSKGQSFSSRISRYHLEDWNLDFGIWDFSGAWCLVLGAFLLTCFPCAASQNLPFHDSFPLYFEPAPNSPSKFLARGPNYQIILAPTEAWLVLSKSQERRQPRPRDFAPVNDNTRTAPSALHTIHLQFLGANQHASISGSDSLTSRINYIVGNDPAKWRTGIPTYGGLQIRSLYPGIDLVCYGNNQQLEYDFTVAPDAHPEQIALHFEGADKITITPQDELVLQVGDEQIMQPLPTVYQMVNGNRKAIVGRYRLQQASTVRFELGTYDHSLPLVIDPVLTYSSYFGGKSPNTFSAIKVDASGNVYVAGTTQGQIDLTKLVPGFDNPGFQPNFQGGRLDGDAFVAKFDNTLTNLIFLTYIGGSSEDAGYDMALDSANNIYLTGFTDSANFPTKVPPDLTNSLPHAGKISGAFNSTFHAYPIDAFVTEIDSTGSNLVYSIYLGGTNDDIAEGISVDAAGNAYITGYTYSTNTVTSICSTNPYLCGCTNIFFLVTCSNTPLSTNFPITPTAFQSVYISTNRTPDAFLARIASGGRNLDYSTYLGQYENVTMQLAEREGSKLILFNTHFPTYGVGVAVNSQSSDGIVYVTGFTQTGAFPTTPNAPQQYFQLNNSTNGPTVIGTNIFAPTDAFLTKFDTTQNGSNSLAFSTLLGGTNDDGGSRITVDPFTGNVYLTGYTKSRDFTNNAGTNILGLYSGLGTNTGLVPSTSDVFLTKFAPDDTVQYSFAFGGGKSE